MTSHYVEPENIVELRGMESLTLYRFGDKLVNHYFCAHCGVYPFHEAIENPGRYRINLACVDDLDLASLEIRLIDGLSF